MALTAEQGYRIREEYSDVKEKQICEKHNLQQIGGSRTKIDGSNGDINKSIKNASGSSTQVHLTTQNHFIKTLGITGNAAEFIRLFCGNKDLNNNGKDRYTIKQIDSECVNEFKNFLTENKKEVVDLVIRNGFNITHVIYNDIKNDVEYELTYQEIFDRLDDCEWVFLRGGIHLKLNGKTLFHFQREGKKNKSNRYNVLWHIHKNVFLCN
jgi:hypothetical protein